jgi:hypothetical protein
LTHGILAWFSATLFRRIISHAFQYAKAKKKEIPLAFIA